MTRKPETRTKTLDFQLILQLLYQMRRLFSASSTAIPKIFDVVIIGGGVVGAALAARLSALPSLRSTSICLVEARAAAPVPLPGTPVDARTYALSPTSISFLESSNSWAPVAASNRLKQFNKMSVWDSCGPARLSWSAPTVGGSLGTMVEHTTLAGVLWNRLETLALESRITLKSGARVGGPPMTLTGLTLPTSPAGGLASLTLSDGSTLQARLVVGADGGASATRTLAGGAAWGGDYPTQRAVVDIVRVTGEEDTTTTATTATTKSTAFQRFLPDGPLALLPMWDNLASVVWSTTPEHAKLLSSLSPQEFALAVDTALHADESSFDNGGNGNGGGDPGAQPIYLSPSMTLATMARAAASVIRSATPASPMPTPPRISALTTATNTTTTTTTTATSSKRAVIPLRLAFADALVRPRLALIGDAARSFHPLAGQGLNQGLLDAAALVNAVETAIRTGADAGSPRALQEYAAARSVSGASAARGVDAILRLWSGRPEVALGSDLGARAPSGLWKRGGLIPALRDLALAALDVSPKGKEFLSDAAGARSS